MIRLSKLSLSKLSRPVLGFALSILVAGSLPVWGQATPIPLPGGDLIPPFGLFNQFFPGGGSTYDGINADPHGITNFRGVSAMGFTNGTATDNNGKTYQVVTDIRVYQGDYVGAKSTFGGGGTTSEKSHGTFVEIWLDFYVPGSGTPVQVNDFNPGITPNGLFWIVQVADDAVKISDEGNTLTLHLANVPVVDQGFFPGGTGSAPATVSFDIVYKKVEGTRRTVRPSTRDRLSPFNWAGKMWTATNSGTFSVSYNDKSFSATGSFMTDTTNPDTTGFGEMGLERNGSFVKDEDFKAADAAAHSAAGDRSAGAAAVETQSAGVRPGPYRTSVLVNQLHQWAREDRRPTVHFSAIQENGYRTLNEGETVEFDLLKGPKGFQAANVVRA